MTTHRWAITAIGCSNVLSAGTAPTLTDTWTAALRVGRAALLSGDLGDLAIRIGDRLEAQITPGRDHAGVINPEELTQSLVEVHQAATAHLIAEALTRQPDNP